eukprot:1844395-Prymnesium_polylepis.1
MVVGENKRSPEENTYHGFSSNTINLQSSPPDFGPCAGWRDVDRFGTRSEAVLKPLSTCHDPRMTTDGTIVQKYSSRSRTRTSHAIQQLA